MALTAEQQAEHPEISMFCLPEMGIQPELLQIVRDREIETQLGQVQMNCEICKFRLAALSGEHSHSHGHSHDHHHHHHHHHDHPAPDPCADLGKYHDRIWQVP